MKNPSICDNNMLVPLNLFYRKSLLAHGRGAAQPLSVGVRSLGQRFGTMDFVGMANIPFRWGPSSFVKNEFFFFERSPEEIVGLFLTGIGRTYRKCGF